MFESSESGSSEHLLAQASLSKEPDGLRYLNPFICSVHIGKLKEMVIYFHLLLKCNDPHLYVLLNIEVLWEMPEVWLNAAEWMFYCSGVVQ